MNVYIVRNQSGQFFRAKGYGGHGESWVDDIAKARIYTKIGPAKATVTFFARQYPQFGTPQILAFELDVTKATVMDMAESTSKRIAAKQQAKLKREKAQTRREQEYLQEQMNSINRRMAARQSQPS